MNLTGRYLEFKGSNFVKYFICKACLNSLPTRQNLVEQKIGDLDKCPICEKEINSTLHILWECPFTADVWGESSYPLHKWSYAATNFQELLGKLFDTLDSNTLPVVTVTFKNIWFRRNLVIFQDKSTIPQRVYQNSPIPMEDFQKAHQEEERNEINTVITTHVEIKTWKKPINHYLKVNWDASVHTQM